MSTSIHKRNYVEVSYDEKKMPRTGYPKELAKYLKKNFFKVPSTLIDVGCGRGEFLEAFVDLGFDVRGVDISPSIDALSSRYIVKKCDFSKDPIPFEDCSIDFLFSKSVVEHLHHPEVMVDECYRVLKTGGRAVFMCPSWIHTYWGPFYIDHTHVTPFTLPSLEQLLELSGFNVIYSNHFIQLPILWKFPILKLLSALTSFLPLPFRPLYKTKMPQILNKWIRFSKEKMLLVVVEKK